MVTQPQDQPPAFIYGTAYAPYIGLSSADPAPTDLDSTFQAINDYLNSVLPTIFQQEMSMANYFGISKVCCYEFGQSLVASNSTQFNLFASAQQDPRMGTLYNNEMIMLQNAGFDICNHYEYCCAWSQYGYWGCVPSLWYLQNSQPTVKYSALASFASTCNCGNAPAPAAASSSSNSGSSGGGNGSGGGSGNSSGGGSGGGFNSFHITPPKGGRSAQ